MNAPPEDSLIRIGKRYRLDERIAAGAMGAVWRATDELLNRTVAVKELLAAAVLPTAADGDAVEESRQRILREGRIGARLQHPHVISMFDVVVHDDRPWLVMEYLPSRSLAQVLAQKGPLEPGEAANVGRQVADGLAAAHLAGVVHRDVKPGNVLIADDGRVKLTDFGVSRASGDVQLTRTGLIAGTPAFLSPEVARGLQPTSASDVFALGATLYASVEGRPPFGLDDNAYALLHKVATGVVEPPRQAGPLTGVIMQLLSREPDDRPSASQAREALAELSRVGSTGFASAGARAGATPVTGDAAPVVRPGPPTKTDLSRPPALAIWRRRSPVLLAALAALIGGVVIAALMANPPGDGTGAAPTVTNAPAAAPPASTDSRTPTATPEPSPTPDPSAVSDPVAFVKNYYALLPGNTDAAFALLSTAAQIASGGRESFDDFYGEMESVTLQDPRLNGDGVVDATVVFDRRNGPTSRESYRFVITTGSNGRTIMQSFSSL